MCLCIWVYFSSVHLFSYFSKINKNTKLKNLPFTHLVLASKENVQYSFCKDAFNDLCLRNTELLNNKKQSE